MNPVTTAAVHREGERDVAGMIDEFAGTARRVAQGRERRVRDGEADVVVAAHGLGRDGRRVRAFGEMVALLWAQGHTAAIVRLEHLWHRMCQERGFSLFCAYPRVGFTQDVDASIREICAAHSKVLCA